LSIIIFALISDLKVLNQPKILKSFILKVFNARPEESREVYLMLMLGFFGGIFLASYDVAAPAIFLNFFSDQTVLAQAFLVSGLIGVLVTYMYSFLQARMSFKALVVIYVIIMLAITAFIWYTSITKESNGPIVFFGFVMALPFSYLTLLIFWGYFGRIFDLKQAKRVIGGIDTGQLIASILALFLIGFILDKNWVVSIDLFVGSLLGLLGMLAASILMNSTLTLATKREGKVKDRTVSMKKLFTNKYTRLMAVFVVISLICITFINYSFLSVTNIQWVTESDKGAFLARFQATVVIFSFLFQTFATDWIIANYGLKTSLLINPALAIILIVATLITGLIMGYSAGSGFIYFFLAVAATKLFIDSLKDALDGPSFKLYFLPINTDIKFDVNTKIEGFVTALGGVFAGGILILMNQFNLPFIYVVVGVLPILIAWYVITNRMYGGYRSTLEEALEASRSVKSKKRDFYYGIDEAKTVGDAINSLKLLEKTEPIVFEKAVLQITGSSKGKLKKYVDQKISALDLTFEERSKTAEGARELKALAYQAANQANKDEVLSIDSDRLYTLAKSQNIEERILACKLLRTLINDANIFVLLELLRDPKEQVKRQAIITARKVKRKETLPLLIDFLGNKTYTYESAAALTACGKEILEDLDNAFHRSGQTQAIMLKLIRIIARIGGDESHKLLWSKIDFPDRKIVRQILTNFYEQNYHAEGHEKIILTDLLGDEIGKAIWNLAAQTELSDNEFNHPLQNALDEEIKSNFEFIYMILSIMYDPESITLVKQNIAAGTTEGSAYAIELLDIFLDGDLKPKLYPLLDDIPTREKLVKLQVFYPRQSYEEHETYNYLLNRESNNVNRWTKACTLYAISQNKNYEIDQSIVAHMFNPDLLLAELATWIIYKTQPSQYRSVVKRLDTEAEALERIIHRVENNEPLVFDSVLLLRQMPNFNRFSGLLISQLINEMSRVKTDQVEELPINDDKQIYLLRDGEATLSLPDSGIHHPIKGPQLFGLLFLDTEDMATLEVRQPCRLYTFHVNSLFNVLTNYPELIEQFMKTSTNTINKKAETTT